MLIVALVLAVIGLAALVTAVVTSNELIAWVCIGASVIGVLLLIVDALRERSKREDDDDESGEGEEGEVAQAAEDYPEEATTVLADFSNDLTGEEVTTVTAIPDDETVKEDLGNAKG